jgi:cyclohexadienyl dehydratase
LAPRARSRCPFGGPLLVAIVLAGALWACAAAPPARVLRVGTSGDYAPFSLRGEGFDLDLARALASDLGYRVELVPFRWPELAERVRAGAFDVAMGGITWRPDRAVVGYMTRAVALGGPCVLGLAEARRIGVNRGGVLERWARAQFPDRELVAVDANLELPRLLDAGRVDAVVTDSFEIASFRRAGLRESCAPPRARQVYWGAPGAGPALGPAIDRWLAANEPRIDALRARWFGSPAPRDALDHLADLLARRMALMPAVASWKRARGLPLEDPVREAEVLERAARRAAEAGADPVAVRELFRVQIELAKAVQARSGEASPTLDLAREIRPLLGQLGDAIVDALVELRGVELDAARVNRALDLVAELTAEERGQLAAAALTAATLPSSLDKFKLPFANLPGQNGIWGDSALRASALAEPSP